MIKVFAVCQAATVSVQVSNGGLGQRISRLTDGEVKSFERVGLSRSSVYTTMSSLLISHPRLNNQGQYASDILYLAALYFSKLSSLAYTIQLTPDARHRQWGKGLCVVVSIWLIISLLGVAFECHLPSPWAIVMAQCINIVRIRPGFHSIDA